MEMGLQCLHVSFLLLSSSNGSNAETHLGHATNSMHDGVESSQSDNSWDPMFLPAELAYRFFNSYKTVIHPLFPVLRMETVRQSIYNAYTLGLGDPQARQVNNLAYQGHRLDRARDFLVLAFGAQIEGGDGDAECHKDVARAWSEILKQKAREIMLEHVQGKGGVDLVNLWVILSAYSRSYGNSDGRGLTCQGSMR